MKKIKFAAQVLILSAAFPVLFVSGINDRTKKAEPAGTPLKEAVSAKKIILGDKCLCKTEFFQYKGMIHQIIVNN